MQSETAKLADSEFRNFSREGIGTDSLKRQKRKEAATSLGVGRAASPRCVAVSYVFVFSRSFRKGTTVKSDNWGDGNHIHGQAIVARIVMHY